MMRKCTTILAELLLVSCLAPVAAHGQAFGSQLCLERSEDHAIIELDS